MSRFCRDCKHHLTVTVLRRLSWTSGMWWWYEEFWIEEHEELKCTAPLYDLVTGRQWNVGIPCDCASLRHPFHECGREGKLWEPKV